MPTFKELREKTKSIKLEAEKELEKHEIKISEQPQKLKPENKN
jgi:hypothetical protein